MTLDLLRTSRVKTELKVMSTGDEVKAEAEVFATATITLCALDLVVPHALSQQLEPTFARGPVLLEFFGANPLSKFS